ncbi:MAG: pyrroline-5-carboxylate reductase [Bacillota bacterium]|nr:pyrroline-5-carboxylate reductase [Bacillota bacterium]
MKIGFIGCGNMACAMMEGMVRSSLVHAGEIMATALDLSKRKAFADGLGIRLTADSCEVAAYADVLFLAVKPHQYASVIEKISDAIRPQSIVVSIAPGFTLEQLELKFGKQVKLVRTMPNTPATVGEGMTAMCSNAHVTPEEIERVAALLKCFGKAEQVEEHQMDAVVAVSGSSPAYAFMMMEAMADAAVLHGLPRDKAYVFAAQALLGAAKMVLELGEHPASLKDKVCSPGGTTIEAVKKLEERGFRSAIMEAMQACAEKSARMNRH